MAYNCVCACVCVCVCVCMVSLSCSGIRVSESEGHCPTLCDPMDYAVHGSLQARILEWVAFPFSRGSSQPRHQTQVAHIAGGLFSSWATREAQKYWSEYLILSPVDLPSPGTELGSPALQMDSLPTKPSGKPIRVMVTSWNEFGRILSSAIFQNSFRRIGVNSSVNVW